MNKRKILNIIIVLICILLIPVIALANRRVLTKDNEGRTIIYSAEDLEEVESGDKIVLAIPADISDNELYNDENVKKEKQQIKDNVSKYSMATEMTQDEINALSEEMEQFENKELIDKTNNFVEVFVKYYGKEYSEELFENIKKETSEIAGEYKVPESSLIMLNKAIELYNKPELTDSEKETLKYVFEIIDKSYIEDSTTLNNMKNAGIEISK